MRFILFNKKYFTEKKKILTWMFIIFFLIASIPFIIKNEFFYARNLEVEGKVVFIEWKSKNHELPKITLLDVTGKEISISHFSIALKKSNLKIGDYLVKEKGNNYCLINGKKINCSKYLGLESIFEILRRVKG